MEKPKILLIEDDYSLSDVLRDFFEDNDIHVTHVDDGALAIPAFQQEKPGLVILDIVLPNKSGFEIIESIRNLDNDTPVILMTGTEFDVESEVKGYTLGAINYMKKPVLPQVLLAQALNLLSVPKDLKRFVIGGLTISIANQELYMNNQTTIKLHEKEEKLLLLLLQNVGVATSRETILVTVWGHHDGRLNNSLDRTILSLRKKMSSYPQINIETIYGVGYKLEIK